MFALQDKSPIKTRVLGVGNLLLSDDGVGLHVVKRLAEAYDLSEGVQTLDGGTLGLDLLCYLEGVENLLILDAVEFGAETGALLRLEGDAVPAFLSIKMSPHQIGVSDMLFAAKLSDLYPRNVVLLGVQPGSLELGLELSPAVAGQVDVLLSQVLEQLAQWGHFARRKNGQEVSILSRDRFLPQHEVSVEPVTRGRQSQ